MQHEPSICHVAHPFGQLQLELDGVPILSHMDLVRSRLSTGSADASATSIDDELEIADHVSRGDRAARLAIVRKIQRPFVTEHGWLFVGGVEASWLYEEGIRTFVNGEHLAALLCLHSSCERAVAGALSMESPELGNKIKRWGLGPLGDAAFKRKLIARKVHEGLKSITEKRNATAHFRFPLDERSVASRTFYDDLAPDDYDATIADDAEEAVSVATTLLGGGIGMGGAIRPRIPPP